MTTPSGNPFLFPGAGLGQLPEHLAGNPLMQSLEMMRKAWSGMITPGATNSGPFSGAPILDPGELDRRITELQTVENWLRLNLSMLQTSIQALEVQRATLATLHSFATLGVAGGGSASKTPPQPATPDTAAGAENAAPTGPSPEPTTEPGAEPDVAAAGLAAQQAWWDMLRGQFNQLASAAAATMPPSATPPDTNKPASKTRKTANKQASKTAAETAPARKRTPRQT